MPWGAAACIVRGTVHERAADDRAQEWWRVMTLVVLAAGLATRFGSDKQLEPVGPAGELLLEYALYDAWRAGCRRAVLVVRAELEPLLEDALRPAWEDRLPLSFVVQPLDRRAAAHGRRRPWGTAHALLAAQPHVSGDLLVCNADDFYGARAFAAVAAALQAADAAHAVAGYPLSHTLSPHGGVSRAVCETDGATRLVRIREHTGIVGSDVAIRDDHGRTLPGDVPVSMNLWGFHASVFAHLATAFDRFVEAYAGDERAELRIPDVVNALVAGGGVVHVVNVEERWFGMTYAADRASVRAALAAAVSAGEYPADLRLP